MKISAPIGERGVPNASIMEVKRSSVTKGCK